MRPRLADRHPFASWLAAATASTLGDSVTFFALGWVAAGHGPGVAGLVLTVEGIPLCLLILAGGVVADRFGVRRVMAGCDAAMALVMAGFAVSTVVGVPVGSLVAVALLAGVTAAVRRPAEGVFPRLFAAGDELTRTMATTTLWLQVARVTGPAVAGVLLATGGLTLTSALDAASFVLVLCVLLRVRPPLEPEPAERDGRPVLAQLGDGLRAARRTPGAPAALLAVVGLAVTVLPLVMLCVPVAGRERGWSSHDTGLVAAAWVVGGIAVTGCVARWGAPSRRVALAGPLVAAAGAVLLAADERAGMGIVAVLLVGCGTSLLTSRLLPTFVAATPPDMLARFQSLLGLAQTGPVLLATPALAAASSAGGVRPSLLALAVVLLATTLPAAAVERAAARRTGERVSPAAAEAT